MSSSNSNLAETLKARRGINRHSGHHFVTRPIYGQESVAGVEFVNPVFSFELSQNPTTGTFGVQKKAVVVSLALSTGSGISVNAKPGIVIEMLLIGPSADVMLE